VPPLRLYLSGDTLVHDDLRQIADRHPDLDLGVLHLGGTRVLGLLLTMDGRQGVDLLEMLRPAVAVPIHYGDYGVFRSPLSDFLAEVDRRRPPSRVVTVGRGETMPLPVPEDWAN
jgi:L-ascorbate metabolism protein UlaG (beta-lactamase superfamily)